MKTVAVVVCVILAVFVTSLAVFSQEQPQPAKPNIEAATKTYTAKCVMCHGKDGEGSKALSVPRLDDPKVLKQFDSVEKLKQVIVAGIERKEGQKAAMPAYDGKLKPNEIDDVTAFVSQLQIGRKTFAAKCAVCHAKEGTGNKALGIPPFVDPQLAAQYDTRDKVKNTIMDGVPVGGGRKVAMPAYKGTLKPAEIDGAVTYVWQLRTPKKQEPKS